MVTNRDEEMRTPANTAEEHHFPGAVTSINNGALEGERQRRIAGLFEDICRKYGEALSNLAKR